MADVVKILRAELVTLELKIQRIRELLALYAEEDAPTVGVRRSPEPQVATVRPPAERVTKAKQMEDAMREYLEPRGIVHRQEILDHLTARGFMEGIKSPMSHLAAFISDHRQLFVGHGGGRWSLASSIEPQVEAPNGESPFGGPERETAGRAHEASPAAPVHH